MSPLTAVEQRVCRQAFGYWLAIQAVGSGFDHAKATAVGMQSSGSHTLDDNRGGWYRVDAAGVGWDKAISVTREARTCEVFVSWARLRDHLLEVSTPALRDDCRAWSADSQAHNLAAMDSPCEPDATKPQGDGDDWRERWHQLVAAPRHAEWRLLQDRQRDLLDRIYPRTAANPEPVDLLDLLASHG